MPVVNISPVRTFQPALVRGNNLCCTPSAANELREVPPLDKEFGLANDRYG